MKKIALAGCFIAAIVAVLLVAKPRSTVAQSGVVLTFNGPQCNNGNLIATEGQFFLCEIDASGGTPPYTWTLPPLASFSAANPGLSYCVAPNPAPNDSCSKTLTGARLLIYGTPHAPSGAQISHPQNFKVKIGA